MLSPETELFALNSCTVDITFPLVHLKTGKLISSPSGSRYVFMLNVRFVPFWTTIVQRTRRVSADF